MKKLLPLLLLSLVLATGCKTVLQKDNAVQQENKNISFEYEAMTRGSFNKVIITHDSIVTVKDRDMKNVVTATISKADWNSLLSSLEKVDVNNIQDLKSPTNKRMYDGALIANLKIIKEGKTYQSAGFDHGEPPAEIKAVVEKIIALSDLKYKK